MQQHGWTLLFHDNLIEQMMKLRAAVLRAQENDPEGFGSNANVKFFRALVQLMQDATSTVKATPWGRPSAIGGGPRSEGDTGCSSATTRRRRSSCTPGSTMNRPCGLREANQTRMPCSRRCSGAGIRRTNGAHWYRQASRIGANWSSHLTCSR